VNDLFYYWTGKHGIVDSAGRLEVRHAIVDGVRRTLRTSEDLSAVLTAVQPYSLLRLITQTGVDSSPAAFERWRDYLPPLVIDGGRTYPDVLIPEIANLVADDESGRLWTEDGDPPKFARRYAISGERARALFGDRLEEALELLAGYGGENPWAVRAKGPARSWIEEQSRHTPS
jgi:hypothetical protein